MFKFLGFSSKETKGSGHSSSSSSSSSSSLTLPSSFVIGKTPEQYFLSIVVKRLLMDDPRCISGSIRLDSHLMMRDPIAALDIFIKNIKQSSQVQLEAVRKHKKSMEDRERSDLVIQDLDASLKVLEATESLASIIQDDSTIVDATKLTGAASELDQTFQEYKAGAETRKHQLADIEKASTTEDHELLRIFEDERRQYAALDESYSVLYRMSRSTALAYQDIVSVLGTYAGSTLVKVINDLSGLPVLLQGLAADKRQTFLMAIKIHLTTIISSDEALLQLFENLSPTLRLEVLPIFDDFFRNSRLTYLSACELLTLLPEDSWAYVVELLRGTMSAANIHRIRVWAPILAQSKDNKINDHDKIQYFKQSLDGRISPEDFSIMFGIIFTSVEECVEFRPLARELFGISFERRIEEAIAKGRSVVEKALEGMHAISYLDLVLRAINFYLNPPFLHRVSSWRSDKSIALATEIQRFLSATQQNSSFDYKGYLQYKLENADIDAFGTFSGLIRVLQARSIAGPGPTLISSLPSSSTSSSSHS